jgi:hypothetical protein
MNTVACSCYSCQFTLRGAATLKIPYHITHNVAYGILGTAAGCLSLVTLGNFEFLNNKSYVCLSAFQKLFANMNHDLFQIVNSQATYSDDTTDGLITALVKRFLWQPTYNPQDFFLKRVIVSRLSYALQLVACVISRVADMILGTILSALSLVTLGSFPRLNSYTYRALQITGIVKDVFYYTTKFLNPGAKFNLT